jgi:Lipid A 3-O-deacylase (PagL)
LLTSQASTTHEPAPDSRRVTVADPTQPADAFGKHALGVEFGVGLLGEAWNLNERREWLADGSLAIWWAFANGARLVIEFHAMRVFQRPSRAAFVNGLTPILRWRLRHAEPWSVFVEFGPGISWSDTAVPPRGTRFNYLIQAGTGLTRRLGRQTHAVVGFRGIHISNNSLEGRDRNPDIEALGGYAGLSVVF